MTRARGKKKTSEALSTEPRELMASEAIKLSSYMTRVLHTARNSNVEVVLINDNEINDGEFLSSVI